MRDARDQTRPALAIPAIDVAPFGKGGKPAAQRWVGDLLFAYINGKSKSPAARCALAAPFFKGGEVWGDSATR